MKTKHWIIGLILPVALLVSACGASTQPTANTGAETAPTSAPAEQPAPAVEPTTAQEPPAAEEPKATEPAVAEPAAPSGEQATISYWFDPPEQGQPANCFVENVIKPFNDQSKTVMVEAVEQPNSWDATRTALAGGAGPDIITTPGPSFAFELGKSGQLLPLDEFSTQYGWGERFIPWALNLGKIEGKLLSIPNEQETLVLYYNKTLFEEKGWQPPKTIDEMAALAAKIKEAGIIPFSHANAEWRPSNEWFAGEWMNHSAGPQKVYDALTGKAKWTDPEFVQAIASLDEFQKNGYFMGGLDRYYTATGSERSAAFGSGQAAMNIEGTWFMNGASQYFGAEAGNTNEWDWVPMPSKSGEAIFDLGIGSTYSINNATKHPQAAAEFMDFMFSPAVQASLVTQCSQAPAPVRLEENALSGIDPRVASLYVALAEASDKNNYGYTTWTFWPPKSDVYIYEEIEKVWAGEMTPEQYLEGLQKMFDQELAAGDIPPIPSR